LALALRSGVLASLRSRACRRSLWLARGIVLRFVLNKIIAKIQRRDPVTDPARVGLSAAGVDTVDTTLVTVTTVVGDELRPVRHS
jgi:hypothetical protein